MRTLHVASKKVFCELMNAIKTDNNWKNTVYEILNENEVVFECDNNALQLCEMLKEKHKRAWTAKA